MLSTGWPPRDPGLIVLTVYVSPQDIYIQISQYVSYDVISCIYPATINEYPPCYVQTVSVSKSFGC